MLKTRISQKTLQKMFCEPFFQKTSSKLLFKVLRQRKIFSCKIIKVISSLFLEFYHGWLRLDPFGTWQIFITNSVGIPTSLKVVSRAKIHFHVIGTLSHQAVSRHRVSVHSIHGERYQHTRTLWFFLNMGHPCHLLGLLLQSYLETQLQQTYWRSIGHVRALLTRLIFTSNSDSRIALAEKDKKLKCDGNGNQDSILQRYSIGFRSPVGSCQARPFCSNHQPARRIEQPRTHSVGLRRTQVRRGLAHPGSGTDGGSGSTATWSGPRRPGCHCQKWWGRTTTHSTLGFYS